ncbi:MAG TPA: hypothetical protein PKY56_06590 [Candidatus Kapabacteria bacterium]|nr:hypothetical protein [Candidatus Kapabacteria bacterium]HPO63195.1 hypothetical protein [Candidatus Kapabacteria bacterium]
MTSPKAKFRNSAFQSYYQQADSMTRDNPYFQQADGMACFLTTP